MSGKVGANAKIEPILSKYVGLRAQTTNGKYFWVCMSGISIDSLVLYNLIISWFLIFLFVFLTWKRLLLFKLEHVDTSYGFFTLQLNFLTIIFFFLPQLPLSFFMTTDSYYNTALCFAIILPNPFLTSFFSSKFSYPQNHSYEYVQDNIVEIKTASLNLLWLLKHQAQLYCRDQRIGGRDVQKNRRMLLLCGNSFSLLYSRVAWHRSMSYYFLLVSSAFGFVYSWWIE